MCPALIGKRIYVVHFLRGQRFCRRILHDPHGIICFRKLFPPERICVLILDPEAFRITAFFGQELLIGRKEDGILYRLHFFCPVTGPGHKGDIFHFDPGIQRIRDLYD